MMIKKVFAKEEKVREYKVWYIIKAYCIHYFNASPVKKFCKHMGYSVLIQGQCEPTVEHEDDGYIYINSTKEIDDITKIIQKGKPHVKPVIVRKSTKL